MSDHDASRRSRRSSADKPVVDSRALLAAVTLLGASLGASAAAPVDLPSERRGPQPDGAAVNVATNKSQSGGSNQVKVQSDQYKANEVKQGQQNKLKIKVNSNQIKKAY
jgi:hypothetical protein